MSSLPGIDNGKVIDCFPQMVKENKSKPRTMLSDKPLTYNPWPLPLDPSLQRPELAQLKAAGYEFDDAREVNTIFENKLCEFTGAKYCVLTDCCTHAIELCLRLELDWGISTIDKVLTIPTNTYISVYQTIKRIGFPVKPIPVNWSGLYQIEGTAVIDSAVRWQEGMYIQERGMLQCLSFQIKKPIPIGRGGCVLTNDKYIDNWLRLARYDGRDMSLPYDHPDHIKMMGYHYYMTPEDAARGILLMDKVTFRGDSASWRNYPDISKYFK